MQVSFSDAAKKDFTSLGPIGQAKVRDKIRGLSSWPSVSGWKPMRGEWAGHGRARAGDWRVVFRLPKPGDNVLVVVKIGHRSGIYDD